MYIIAVVRQGVVFYLKRDGQLVGSPIYASKFKSRERADGYAREIDLRGYRVVRY